MHSDVRLSLLFKIICCPCRYNHKQWNIKDSSICIYCNEVHTLCHYFAQCKSVCDFWKSLKAWYLHALECGIIFTALDILLGRLDHRRKLFNYSSLHAVYCSYSNSSPYTLLVHHSEENQIMVRISTLIFKLLLSSLQNRIHITKKKMQCQ